MDIADLEKAAAKAAFPAAYMVGPGIVLEKVRFVEDSPAGVLGTYRAAVTRCSAPSLTSHAYAITYECDQPEAMVYAQKLALLVWSKKNGLPEPMRADFRFVDTVFTIGGRPLSIPKAVNKRVQVTGTTRGRLSVALVTPAGTENLAIGLTDNAEEWFHA